MNRNDIIKTLENNAKELLMLIDEMTSDKLIKYYLGKLHAYQDALEMLRDGKKE